MKRIKTTQIIILSLLCLCFLSACGDRKVEYGNADKEGTTAATEQAGEKKNEESGNGDTLPGALAKSLGAKAKWEADWALEQGEDGAKLIKVNADVDVPDTDAMQVVKMAAKEYTPEEKKKIAETLFDEGSIVMIGNGGYETKEEIKQMIDSQKNWLIEGQEEEQYDGWEEEAKAYIDYYQGLYDNFSEITENDYSEGSYRGTVNGQSFSLDFGREIYEPVQDEASGAYKMEKMVYHKVSFRPDINRGNIRDKLGDYGLNASEADFGENQAKMSEEDAKKMALSYCEALGISGMEVTNASDLNWGVYKFPEDEEEAPTIEKAYCNGYIIILRRCVNGVPVFKKEFTYMIYSTYGDDVTENVSPEILAFYLTDDGIVEMSYQSPMEVKEVLTEHTELLAYSKVQDVLKQHSVEFFNNYPPGTTVFLDTLELCYMCVRDEKDSQTCYLLPVWCLYEGSSLINFDYYGANDPFYPDVVRGIAVNAVDGNMIDVMGQQGD